MADPDLWNLRRGSADRLLRGSRSGVCALAAAGQPVFETDIFQILADYSPDHRFDNGSGKNDFEKN